MHLDLSDEEAAALTQELHEIVESDRYPLSPRIRTLRAAILVKLKPEPAREPLPRQKPVRGLWRGQLDDLGGDHLRTRDGSGIAPMRDR
jgi:hypothetical protein